MPAPKTPLLTVDCAVFDRAGRILLVRRRNAPFKGQWALPGGFVDLNETVEDACRREVMEETGLKLGGIKLVGIYSAPGRDPRGPTCSVAFLARTARRGLAAGDDASDAEWIANWRKIELAFDHDTIIKDALRLLKAA